MASIGQELLNVPMGDMIRQMAFAIAEAQHQLDENSINTAEMMGGLTTVYDENGEVTFDDSRVFFGYEYMKVKDAIAFATVDDAVTGSVDEAEAVKLLDVVKKIKEDGGYGDDDEIRVPTRASMLELGFTPTFYQFVDTIIEVKIAIKITRTREYTHGRTTKETSRSSAYKRKRSFWGTKKSSNASSQVTTSQVDASYSSKYSYTAEGASLLRTKLTPVPPPAILEDRIRGLIAHEEELRRASLEAKRKELGLDTDNG